MEFTFKSKSNTFFGKGCVKAYAADWIAGKRAFVVTGRHSGRASGALGDVEDVLRTQGIPFETYEGIDNNPTVEQCREVGMLVRAAGADFVVGIGGGSPLDAAKAVAVFAVEDISTENLYKNAYRTALPAVAIPTTSGTGSEVTPWSILTRKDIETKRSFGSLSKTMPVAALLDPEYTRSLPQRVTLHTAMDACTHCMESIITKKATPVTDALNLEALRRFGPCMRALEQGELEGIREELMVVSMLGGMTITHTGTTLMHGMGYPLTYYMGLAHGEANCVVLPGYLRFIQRVLPDRLALVLGALGMDSEELTAYVQRNFPLSLQPNDAQLRCFTEKTMEQNSTRNIDYPVRFEEVEAIYRDALQAYMQ